MSAICRTNGVSKAIGPAPLVRERALFCQSAHATSSSEDLLNDFPVYVRQPEIPPLKSVGQFGVLEPKTMQNRRLKFVHVHAVFGDAITHLVRRAVRDAPL